MKVEMSSKIGRPPRISRERVLAAAAEIAAADQTGSVSIGGIARRLKVSPMAIYTYFSSKDQLMQALSQRLLQGIEFSCETNAEPIARVRVWAVRIREHFLANPPLIQMLTWEGGHNSVAWLNTSDFLLAALKELGLDDAAFAQTVLWTWTCVLNAVQFEIFDRRSNPRLSAHEYAELSEAVRDGIAIVDGFLRDETHYQCYFEFQMARMLDGLRAMERSALDARANLHAAQRSSRS